MEKEYNVGTWLTPSDDYIKDIKQTLVEKGLATEETPHEELNGILKDKSFFKSYCDFVKDLTRPFGSYATSDADLKNMTNEDVEMFLGDYDVTENVERIVCLFGSDTSSSLKPSKITKLPLFNTSKCKTFNGAFSNLSNLQEVPLYDTSNAEDVSTMFSGCGSLEYVPSYNLSKAKKSSSMFRYCYKLKRVSLDLSTVETTRSMFGDCKSLLDADFDLSSNKDANGMFSGCEAIKTITLRNTSKVTDFGGIATNCMSLETFTGLDMVSVTSLPYSMFGACRAMTNLMLYNIGISLQIGSGTNYGHLLTLDSLINTCKECIKQSSSRTLTVGTANIEKLSTVTVKFTDPTIVPSETAIAVGEKGDVVVCEPTDEGAMYISEYMALKNWTLA